MISYPLADAGAPDTTGSVRFLLWLARMQWRMLVLGMLCGVVWMLCIALIPAAIGRGIDIGMVGGDREALVRWSLVIVGLGVVAAVFSSARHWVAVQNWLGASYRGAQLVEESVRRSGPALTRRLPAGDVIAIFATDIMRLGGLYDMTARFAGAIVSYLVVALILLRASAPLGLLVLVGAPLLLASLTLVVRPLQRRQAAQREEAGRLTVLGSDTVAGLRVLRGIGGEDTFLRRYEEQSGRVRAAGVQVAGVQAALDSAQVLLPGVFVVLVTWVGARFALQGSITPGQLVAFYGYTAFLTMPLRTATEFTDRMVRAHIAAGKMLRILAVRPDHDGVQAGLAVDAAGDALADQPEPAGSGVLLDTVSGVRVLPGRLTALVSARPEDSAAVADRLGRIGPGPHEVRWGEVALDELPLEQVRRRIVVSEADPRLFTGSLREELWAGRQERSDARLLACLEVASGADILDALPDGLGSIVEERGRALSGGQRQRLALARVLLRDPEVLVLVEPTSAVDAHTEARIALRLAQLRLGRTTVVTTTSPLLLDQADEVVLLEDAVVTARGSHPELLREHAAYREVVLRGGD